MRTLNRVFRGTFMVEDQPDKSDGGVYGTGCS
jgi:hypothetical protein